MNSARNLDDEILLLLEQDGRLTNREVARRLNISETVVRQRLNRTFASGRARRGVIVDFSVLDVSVVACIRLVVAAPRVDAVLETLAAEPDIGLVMSTTGEFNVYAIAAVRDHKALEKFLDSSIRQLEGVLSSQCSIIGEAIKYDTRLLPFRS